MEDMIYLCLRLSNDVIVITDFDRFSPYDSREFPIVVVRAARAERFGLAHESPESIVVRHHHIESWRFISIAVKCTVMTLIRNRHFSESVICRSVCTWAALTPKPTLDCMSIIRGYYLFMIWLLFWPANIVFRTYLVLFAACDGFMALGTCVSGHIFD